MLKQIGAENVNIEIGMMVVDVDGDRMLVVDTGFSEKSEVVCVRIGRYQYDNSVVRLAPDAIIAVYSVNVRYDSLHIAMSGRSTVGYDDIALIWAGKKIVLSSEALAMLQRDTLLMYRSQPYYFCECGPSPSTLYLYKDGRNSKTCRGTNDVFMVDTEEVSMDQNAADHIEKESPTDETTVKPVKPVESKCFGPAVKLDGKGGWSTTVNISLNNGDMCTAMKLSPSNWAKIPVGSIAVYKCQLCKITGRSVDGEYINLRNITSSHPLGNIRSSDVYLYQGLKD